MRMYRGPLPADGLLSNQIPLGTPAGADTAFRVPGAGWFPPLGRVSQLRSTPEWENDNRVSRSVEEPLVGEAIITWSLASPGGVHWSQRSPPGIFGASAGSQCSTSNTCGCKPESPPGNSCGANSWSQYATPDVSGYGPGFECSPSVISEEKSQSSPRSCTHWDKSGPHGSLNVSEGGRLHSLGISDVGARYQLQVSPHGITDLETTGSQCLASDTPGAISRAPLSPPGSRRELITHQFSSQFTKTRHDSSKKRRSRSSKSNMESRRGSTGQPSNKKKISDNKSSTQPSLPKQTQNKSHLNDSYSCDLSEESEDETAVGSKAKNEGFDSNARGENVVGGHPNQRRRSPMSLDEKPLMSPLKVTDESSNSEESSGSESESSSSEEEQKPAPSPPASPLPSDNNHWSLEKIFNNANQSSNGGNKEDSSGEANSKSNHDIPKESAVDPVPPSGPPPDVLSGGNKVKKFEGRRRNSTKKSSSAPRRIAPPPKAPPKQLSSEDESATEEPRPPPPKPQKRATKNYVHERGAPAAKSALSSDSELEDESERGIRDGRKRKNVSQTPIKTPTRVPSKSPRSRPKMVAREQLSRTPKKPTPESDSDSDAFIDVLNSTPDKQPMAKPVAPPSAASPLRKSATPPTKAVTASSRRRGDRPDRTPSVPRSLHEDSPPPHRRSGTTSSHSRARKRDDFASAQPDDPVLEKRFRDKRASKERCPPPLPDDRASKRASHRSPVAAAFSASPSGDSRRKKTESPSSRRSLASSEQRGKSCDKFSSPTRLTAYGGNAYQSPTSFSSSRAGHERMTNGHYISPQRNSTLSNYTSQSPHHHRPLEPGTHPRILCSIPINLIDDLPMKVANNGLKGCLKEEKISKEVLEMRTSAANKCSAINYNNNSVNNSNDNDDNSNHNDNNNYSDSGSSSVVRKRDHSRSSSSLSPPNEDDKKIRAICSIYRKRPSSVETDKNKRDPKTDPAAAAAAAEGGSNPPERKLSPLAVPKVEELHAKKEPRGAKEETRRDSASAGRVKRRDSCSSASSVDTAVSASSPRKSGKKSRKDKDAPGRDRDRDRDADRRSRGAKKRNKSRQKAVEDDQGNSPSPSPSRMPLDPKSKKRPREDSYGSSVKSAKLSASQKGRRLFSDGETGDEGAPCPDRSPPRDIPASESHGSRYACRGHRDTPSDRERSSSRPPDRVSSSSDERELPPSVNVTAAASSLPEKAVEENVAGVAGGSHGGGGDTSEYHSLPSSEHGGSSAYRSGEERVSPPFGFAPAANHHPLLDSCPPGDACGGPAPSVMALPMPSSSLDYHNSLVFGQETVASNAPIYVSYFERRIPDVLKDNTQYLSRAKELKHLADKESHRVLQTIIYLEAVLYFILTGESMECDPATVGLAYTMFKDTFKLIRHVSLPIFKAMGDKKDLNFSRLSVILAILSLRCQSLLSMKLYRMKRGEVKEAQSVVSDYVKMVCERPGCGGSQGGGGAAATPWSSHRSAANHSPSSLSPTPSPAGSVGSEGSQSSGYSTEGGPRGGGGGHRGGHPAPHTPPQAAAPPAVPIPVEVHPPVFRFCRVALHLYHSYEMWHEADEHVLRNGVKDFFIELDRAGGPLTLHSSLRELVGYVQRTLERLKKSIL